MNNEYSVWVMSPSYSLPPRVKKSVEFHAEITRREKNRNAYCSLYTYKIGDNYMMRVGIHHKIYSKSYFEVYSEGCSSDDYQFYIEEGYHGDLFDYESYGIPLLFEIKLNQPFKVGDTTMILEKDPNLRDRLCNFFMIRPL